MKSFGEATALGLSSVLHPIIPQDSGRESGYPPVVRRVKGFGTHPFHRRLVFPLLEYKVSQLSLIVLELFLFFSVLDESLIPPRERLVVLRMDRFVAFRTESVDSRLYRVEFVVERREGREMVVDCEKGGSGRRPVRTCRLFGYCTRSREKPRSETDPSCSSSHQCRPLDRR